jgi:hypothetical protein
MDIFRKCWGKIVANQTHHFIHVVDDVSVDFDTPF